MIEVGLTGGIGSGKSTVSGMLMTLGALVIDADELAREVLSPGGAAYGPAVSAFGKRILTSDGSVDRAALARVVFRDEQRRKLLESIVHPAVFELERGMLEYLGKSRPDAIVVFDAALLVESGAYARMDKVIVVWCGPDTQMERLVMKKGLDPEEARLRIAAQMPLDEKLEYADYIIDNDGELDATRKRVEEVFRDLLQYV